MRRFMYGGSYLGRADFRLKFTQKEVQWTEKEADMQSGDVHKMGQDRGENRYRGRKMFGSQRRYFFLRVGLSVGTDENGL